MTSISKEDVYGRSIGQIMRHIDVARAREHATTGPTSADNIPQHDEAARQQDILNVLEQALGGKQAAAAPPLRAPASRPSSAFAASSASISASTSISTSTSARSAQVSCFDFEMKSINHQRLIQLQVNAEPKLDSEGRVVGVVCVGQDVFSQKAMAKKQLENHQLKEINEAKDAFLACMSHEMRTPLNGLLGMLQATPRPPPPRPCSRPSPLLLGVLQVALAESDEGVEAPPGDKITGIRRYLVQAKNSAMLLLNLINDILDITRIETGQLSLDLAPFSLQATLDESIAVVQQKAVEKSLALELEVDPHLAAVWLQGDAKRIQQVVLNLLWNALKFTPEGQVRLRATRVGEWHWPKRCACGSRGARSAKRAQNKPHLHCTRHSTLISARSGDVIL